MTYRQKLAEYFRRNAEENERLRRLLHEADDYDYARLDDAPQSKWEAKILDIFPKREMDNAMAKWRPLDKDLAGDKKIIEAAKKGDKSASIYIWATKVRDIVAQNFWKFLGPDPVIRKRRIENNELYDYVSLAWGVMTFGNKDLLGDAGLLERFKPDVYDHGTVWKQFRNMFRMLLQNTTTAYNNSEKLGGVAGLKGSIARGTLGADEGIAHQSYDGAFDDVDAQGGKNEVGFTKGVEGEIVEEDEARRFKEEFFVTWRDFANDEDMKDKGNDRLSAGEVFAMVVGDQNASITSIAQRYREKPETVRAKMQQAIDIMHDYGIENDDLQRAIKTFGNGRLASVLSKEKAPPERAARKPTPKKEPAEPDASTKKKSYSQDYYARMKAAGKIPQKKKIIKESIESLRGKWTPEMYVAKDEYVAEFGDYEAALNALARDVADGKFPKYKGETKTKAPKKMSPRAAWMMFTDGDDWPPGIGEAYRELVIDQAMNRDDLYEAAWGYACEALGLDPDTDDHDSKEFNGLLDDNLFELGSDDDDIHNETSDALYEVMEEKYGPNPFDD
jgi:hypothetical protein